MMFDGRLMAESIPAVYPVVSVRPSGYVSAVGRLWLPVRPLLKPYCTTGVVAVTGPACDCDSRIICPKPLNVRTIWFLIVVPPPAAVV